MKISDFFLIIAFLYPGGLLADAMSRYVKIHLYIVQKLLVINQVSLCINICVNVKVIADKTIMSL